MSWALNIEEMMKTDMSVSQVRYPFSPLTVSLCYTRPTKLIERIPGSTWLASELDEYQTLRAKYYQIDLNAVS